MEKQVIKFFNAGKELPEKSNDLWLIRSGIVKSYTIDRQNKTAILGFWGEQDVVGKSLSNIQPYFLQCMTDVTAVSVPVSNWESISSNLLDRSRQIQELFYIIRNPQEIARLWLLLKWLGNKFGQNIPQGKIIELKLTTKELADTLGIDRILVGELLEQLQQEELISRSPEQNIILKTTTK